MRSLGLTLMVAGSLAAAGAACAKDRAEKARAAREPALRALFEEKGVAYPPPQIFLRAFKDEDVLELWAGARGAPLTLVKTFAVCSRSGALGPKREQGDLQVPEGFYVIDRFNPTSQFHLSLGLDYPNASDRLRGTRGRLGGDIFIHGDCVTVGCLPLRDGPIESLYVVALAARMNGQRAIPVHIFPSRLDAAGLAALKKTAKPSDDLFAFWKELAPGYEAFERTRRVPKVSVHPKTGAYRIHRDSVSGAEPTAGAAGM